MYRHIEGCQWILLFFRDHEWTWSSQSRNQIIDYQPRMDTNGHDFLQSTEYTEETEASQTSAIILKYLWEEGDS